MSEKTFVLPDLGEGLTEGEVVTWEVALGEQVAVDQVIAVVETAKAQVELPCPYAGTVAKLHVEPGQVLDVGKPLISIETSVGSDSDTVLAQEASRREPQVQERMEEERAGSGNVLIGYGTSETTRVRRRRIGRASPSGVDPAEAGSQSRSVAATQPQEMAPADSAAQPTGAAAQSGSAATQAVRVISPLVRKLAREHALDLLAITPTGAGGVITRRDVEAAASERAQGSEARADQAGAQVAQSSPADAASGAGAPDASPTAPVGLRDERIPITGIRKVMAERLSRSRTEIPDATTWVDVDASGLAALKADIAACVPQARIGYLALLARIVVAGLVRFPELNARVDQEAREIVRLPHVHLSFAAQGPRGLVVPVVHHADQLSTEQLAAAIRDLTERARAGTLSPQEMSGGTFTLNNYGVYGVDGSTPIINHPEAGMLGVGRIIDKPWVVEGQLAVRPVTQLSLSFDHRVCDGAVAGGFLRYVADCVERPGALLVGL
ncbi:dihydrolipoamide acetyltransferase family protein [Gephyromycinifex aptenodytis]|uniref:dihydrolipoamide acetyltransferase family protein n=1 Tax=Gephyromycinifex aptenodytis TaxID=2716227 RepID=UPI0014482E28|nr:dihydrolipoamide acetyltransferase family protein [Gephyromycinifex aptenodytis]